MNIGQVREKIEADLAILGLNDCCRSIFDAAIESPIENPVFTYEALLDFTHRSCSLDQLQRCLNYLKSPPLSVFKQKYQFVEDSGDFYELDIEALRDAAENGVLAHPHYSYNVDNYMQYVYVVFVFCREVLDSES